VPFAMWGSGVARGKIVGEPRSILDLAPTICFLLGVEPPSGSVGRVLIEATEKGS
jgi:arylsulfatase A-like enzyme